MPYQLRARAGKPLLLVGLLALLWTAPALAAEGPEPPCDGQAPVPAYAVAGPVPNVAAWSGDDLGGAWKPPACTGWDAVPFATLTALAARFSYDGGVDGLLGRLGAVSTLKGVRYWSVSDGEWRDLVDAAHALDAKGGGRRGDFSAAELRGGAPAYFYQDAGGIASGAAYAVRVLEATSNRLVVAIENAEAVKATMFVTVFDPGALQTVLFFERQPDGLWGHYALTRTTKAGTNSLVEGKEKSFINRGVALFRHIAGIPTDQEPPVAR